MISDPESGLEGVIVVHSTVLGPAAGGCRFWNYASADDMVRDATRLAEGMSYKNAMAGLPLGGGKAVLRRPAGDFDRSRLFRAFGRAVEALDGRYVTAEDVGTSVADMIEVSTGTAHVAGLPTRGDRPGGDPSPATARGVLLAMATATGIRLGKSLGECTVAIQGLGHVGAHLARMLHAAGARLIVADVAGEKVARIVAELGATAAPVEEILAADADVFAPCALGGVLTTQSVRSLRASVVCGAANNQLLTEEAGTGLAAMDVLYAPDFVVNAGGIINAAAEHLGWSAEAAARLVGETGARLERVLQFARRQNLAPHQAATELARTIIAEAAMRGDRRRSAN
jgi:leucine dehydrogenase